jgi:ribosomal protein S18 acetylase RimI-like enzyme
VSAPDKTATISIRHFRDDDWLHLWPILRTTFASGDTYAFDPQSSEEEIHHAWVEAPMDTFVALDQSGAIVGTYFIKANQPGLGSHICNCGYVVSAEAQGKGIAAAMCEHSQATARAMSFRAMQFNLVVSTNERAVRLWQRLGFAIIGTVPEAFQHQQRGFVDAFVMHKRLVV